MALKRGMSAVDFNREWPIYEDVRQLEALLNEYLEIQAKEEQAERVHTESGVYYRDKLGSDTLTSCAQSKPKTR